MNNNMKIAFFVATTAAATAAAVWLLRKRTPPDISPPSPEPEIQVPPSQQIHGPSPVEMPMEKMETVPLEKMEAETEVSEKEVQGLKETVEDKCTEIGHLEEKLKEQNSFCLCHKQPKKDSSNLQIDTCAFEPLILSANPVDSRNVDLGVADNPTPLMEPLELMVIEEMEPLEQMEMEQMEPLEQKEATGQDSQFILEEESEENKEGLGLLKTAIAKAGYTGKENKEGLGLLKTAIAKAGYTGKLSNAHYPVTHSDVAQIHDSTDELLPKTLVVTLGQGSTVTSMEFHPSRATLLLVGTNNGDIAFWDIASQERLDYKNFEVWDRSSCSSLLQESLTKDPAILVKRVAWSHDGSQIGVAYSKHLVHLYTYNCREHLIQYLEIEAHVGGVNDLVFPEPNGLVVVITCGDDKLIKIWDTTYGFVLFTFEGHETPVYSICPQSRDNTKFIFSTSFDGKIKAWLYDHSEPKVDFTAPGNSCTRLAYTDDGKRLFSCGTSKDGDTHIVEWNESEGTLKQRYKGLQKPSTGVVQFDMTKNRFLAAGDDFLIKFWDMDSAALLTTTDAEGGLQASPHVRFNKSGSLLAVSTKENSIKVLASVDGLKLLRSCENRSSDAVRLVSEAMTKVPTIRPSSSVSAMTATGAAMANRDDLVPSVAESQNGDTPSMEDVKPRIINEPIEKSKPSKLPEINESSQCSLMMLPDDFSSAKKLKITETETKETVDKCKRSEEEMRKEDREVEEEITSLSKKMNRLKEELSRVKEAAQLLMTTSADGLGELGSMIEENNEDFLKRLSEYTAEIKTVKAYLLEQFAEKRKLKKEMRELERRLKLKEEELLAKEEEKRVELEDMKKKREERNKEINNTTRERRREAVEKERRKGMRIEMTKRRQREQDQFEKHVKRMRQATDERDGKQKEMGKPVRSELKSTAKPSKVVFEPSTPKNYQIWSNELTEEQSYEMTPYMDSDTEEVYNREGKYIPLWARKENLNQIILRNQDLDPEAIFATKRSFNLDEVFGSR